MATAATAAITSHEKVCSERWRSTMDTMKEIKSIMAWAGISLVGSMGTVIVLLLQRP